MKIFSAITKIKKIRPSVKTALVLLALSPCSAFASDDTSTGFLMFLSVIAGWLDGPIAHWLAIIGVAFAGFTIAFGDFQSGGARGLKIGVGIAIAFGASSLLATLFPAAGAVIG